MQINTSVKHYSIPLHHELLVETDYNYEETVILNQLLYSFNNNPSKSLNVYDIKNMSCYCKSVKTLRKVLERLINKGFVLKSINSLYNTYYYSINPDYFLESNELVSLIETKDLEYGDYHYAALTNFFRFHLLDNGKTTLEISVRQLKKALKMDKSLTSIRTRLNELENNNVVKRKLNGRIYTYELYPDVLLNRTPEVVAEYANDLDTLLTKHCERFGYHTSSSSLVVFKRMLDEGYSYEDLRHIIAYLGNAHEQVRRLYTSASHLRNAYEKLFENASKELSKSKANKYLARLIKNQIPIEINTVSAISDDQIWQETLSLLEKNKGIIYNSYLTAINTNRLYGEFDDYFNDILMEVYTKAKSKRISPLAFQKTYLQKLFQYRVVNSYREQAPLFELEEDIIGAEDVIINTNMYYITDPKKIPVELSHIPVKHIQLFMDYSMKSVNGKRSQESLAIEYEYSTGKTCEIIKYVQSEIAKHFGHTFDEPPPD